METMMKRDFPRKRNPLAREVRTPKYRQRVERDKSKFYRKIKHKRKKNA